MTLLAALAYVIAVSRVIRLVWVAGRGIDPAWVLIDQRYNSCGLISIWRRAHVAVVYVRAIVAGRSRAFASEVASAAVGCDPLIR